MQTIEYLSRDKSTWGDGPWQNEPDKVQYPDPHTGLPCLIVRNPMGALCGYVGVPKDHPAYGRHYDQVDADVHGGLTFSGHCRDTSPVEYQAQLAAMPKVREQAEKHPKGDAARILKEWESVMHSYEAWLEKARSRSICHLVDPEESDDVWWLGFDCGHAYDLAPGMIAQMRELGVASWRADSTDVYRTIEYVKDQIADLAQQLKEMAA
jgi:hypothetical protein